MAKFVASLLVVLAAFGVRASAQEQPKEAVKDDEAKIVNMQTAQQFMTRLNRGIELLSKNLYRPVDEDQAAVEAIRGLYKHLNRSVPKEIEDRFPRGPGQKKSDKFEDQLKDALDELDGIASKTPARFALLTDAYMQLGNRKAYIGNDAGTAFRAVLRNFEGKAEVLSPESVTRLRRYHNTSKFGEIGLEFVRATKNGPLVVVSTVKDGPAHRGGVRVGDQIVRFDLFADYRHQPLPEPQAFSTRKYVDATVNRMLFGWRGEKVRLAFERDGMMRELTLVREAVKREAFVGAVRKDDNSWNYFVDEKEKIAYVRILDFMRTEVLGDFEELLTQLAEQKIRGLILDLRYVGSGSTETAVAFADLFIDEEPIVEIRGRNADSGLRKGTKERRLNVPMACLVNGEGSVCGEIIASCLQDQRRAAIVGERTAGSGAVVQYYPFEGGILQITTAHCYRPNGKALDRAMAEAEKSADWGVTPDRGLAIELTAADREALRQSFDRQRLLKEDGVRAEAFRDLEREAAVTYLRGKIGAK